MRGTTMGLYGQMKMSYIVNRCYLFPCSLWVEELVKGWLAANDS